VCARGGWSNAQVRFAHTALTDLPTTPLQGATCLVHLSAMAADPHSLSRWARTKAAGEAAVRAAAPGATIIRPSDVFGPEDRFLNLFATMHARFPRVPLVEGGTARVQPLFVQDLAQAVFKVATSEDPEFMLGQTYDLAGASCGRGPDAGVARVAERRGARGPARPPDASLTSDSAPLLPTYRSPRRPRRVHVPRGGGVRV
jgi:uncharacterized protein YbjT (DUF2867 family)